MEEKMNKLLLSITGVILSLGIGILIMIFGWGLTPVSWGWILGGGMLQVFIVGLFSLGKE